MQARVKVLKQRQICLLNDTLAGDAWLIALLGIF